MNVRSTTKPRKIAPTRPTSERHRVGEPGHPVGRAAGGVLGEQQDREDRGHRAEVALGEVDDAVGAVDEREPDREQRGERTDERALHDDAERRVPEHVGDVDEDDRRDCEREHRDASRRVAIEVDERDDGDEAEQLFLAIARFGEPERERRRRRRPRAQPRTAPPSVPPVRQPRSPHFPTSVVPASVGLRSRTEMIPSAVALRAAGTSRPDTRRIWSHAG